MVKYLMITAIACVLLSCVEDQASRAIGAEPNADISDASESHRAGDTGSILDIDQQPGGSDGEGLADQESADLSIDASPTFEEAGVDDSGSSVPPPHDAEIVSDTSVVQANLTPGLFAEYFAQYRTPVLQRIELAIDHQWGEGQPHPSVPADFFAARWTGFIQVPEDGEYTFWVISDDGVRVWVGGQQIIDAWRFQAPQRYQSSQRLARGLSEVRVEYMERNRGAVLRFGWSSAGVEARLLGADDLLTNGESAGLPSPRVPYINPILGQNCPDPGVTHDAETGEFYAICTGGPFIIWRSADLVFWQNSGRVVFPEGKPDWAENGRRNWAPEIHRVSNRWVIYYTTVNGDDILSIGAAFSDSPIGPYQDLGQPLVEHPMGVIDAHYFLDDDGRHYLTYKIDGNATGQPTPILMRELEPDGLSFVEGSEAVELLRNDPNTWEGGVVEAQWLVKRNGQYYLFYSGNVYDHRYRTGVAKAGRVTGPYVKHGAPILGNNQRWVGPGHGSIVRVRDQDIFVYHAWPANQRGTHEQEAGRHILADRIRWDGDWPSMSDGTPSITQQPPFP